MKGALLSVLVALATMAVIVECKPNSRVIRAEPTSQDVSNMMPTILAAMIRYGPNTKNADLNAFIKVIIESDIAAAKSPTGQITKEQFVDFSSRGLATICTATNTSKANIVILNMLLSQGMQMSPNQNMDTIVRMLGQTVCYLGDGTKASTAAVVAMFMDFLTIAPKAATTNTGTKAFGGFDVSKLVAKPTAKAPPKPTAKAPAKAPPKAAPKAAPKVAPKAAPKVAGKTG